MLFSKGKKNIRLPRWSTLVPIILYIIFISIILNITFPLKQHIPQLLLNHRQNRNNGIENGEMEISSSSKSAQNLHAPNTVILGNSINEKNILKTAFKNANTNGDLNISIQELARYINRKIQEHIEYAIGINPTNFAQIDLEPRDGVITWEEYHSFFLKEHGMDPAYILKHSEEKHISLDRKAKEDMMRDKALWSEAARSDPFSLTLDEFLAFRHPESSAVNLLSLVDDILRQFDVDGDDHLTIDEFSDVTVDDADEKYRKTIISNSVKERREEFKRLLDKNKDGKADRAELLKYVDPRHPKYALQEAATLISLADTNKDGMLSLQEILSHSDIFMTSKMIDTSHSFHDEF